MLNAGGVVGGVDTIAGFRLDRRGVLHVIPNALQSATCWLVVTQNDRFLYTTNTGSGSVSAFAVGQNGSLTLRDSDGVVATTGPASGPADAALSSGSRFLFTLNNGNRTISGFRVGPDGPSPP